MGLSKTQTARLVTFMSIVFNEKIPQEYIDRAVSEGFVLRDDDGYFLTKKGLSEKNRLCALIGVTLKYVTEKKSPSFEGQKKR
tara:strand:+ start:161 stop:409 length:249 start_codon:yes stop_codon:yes gene_type:complete